MVIHNEAKYRCTIHRFKLNLIERTKFTRHRHHMLQVYVSCVKNFMSVLDLRLLSFGKHIYAISCIGSLLYDTIYALWYASILNACVYYYNVHIRAGFIGTKVSIFSCQWQSRKKFIHRWISSPCSDIFYAFCYAKLWKARVHRYQVSWLVIEILNMRSFVSCVSNVVA